MAAIALVGVAPAQAQRLIVLSSSDALPYAQALAGIQKQGLPVEALTLNGDGEAQSALARAGRDAAIVTLGAKAAELVARAAPAAPIVNCMMLGGDTVQAPAGTIVVPLEIPFESHVTWMKRLLPDARSVGILFNPEQNERRAAEGAATFKRAGYSPLLQPVTGPAALPTALKQFTNAADVLQALPDTTVFTGEHARALLLFSFRNHIPLAGPSDAWVRAGALYAVDWDYQDLGRYCAATAIRQWSGSRAAAPPPPPPPRMQVTVNLRSAEQLRIKWDAETLRSVDKVYE